MTYEQKAEIFTNLIATSGSVVDALRRMEQQARPRGHRLCRLSTEQIGRLRQLRADGWKLAPLGDLFGLTEARVSQLCRGVPKPPREAEPAPHPLGLAIFREIERLLDLRPAWQRSARRGRPRTIVYLARHAAIVAMRNGGLTFAEIGALLCCDPCQVRPRLARAKEIVRAAEIADVALAEARQRVELAAGVCEEEAPAQVEQGRAA